MKIDNSINRSAMFGRLDFPTRKDYIEYFIGSEIIKSEAELFDNVDLVSLMHKHWHGEGRNGCIFALLAAKGHQELGWKDFVITKGMDAIEDSNITNLEISKKISEATKDPKCEVLSLLFSNITKEDDLVRLIKYLLTSDEIFLQDQLDVDEYVTLQLRVEIVPGVLSWLMAFGEYPYFPLTRQSPITEIAIRIKPKPEKLFHRLNKDENAAHLADFPLPYQDDVMEKTWKNTEKRTRYILGEEPNELSAARSTFVIPKSLWKFS